MSESESERTQRIKTDNIIGDICALYMLKEKYEGKLMEFAEFKRRAKALAQDLINDIEGS